MASGIKNFLVTFLIALVIFGLIAFLVVGLVLDSLGLSTGASVDDGPVDEYIDNQGNAPADNIKGSSFNLLFVLASADTKNDSNQTDDAEERRMSADTILLLCVNKERKEFAFSSIDPCTVIEKNGEAKTFSDIFGDEGLAGLKQTVKDFTGLEIDKYALTDINKFPGIIDEIGGVEFNVPCDMECNDDTAHLYLTITAGQQHIDGKTALAMLRFDDYPENGANSRMRTTVSFARAFMKKLCSREYMSRAEGILENLTEPGAEKLETDFNAADISANRTLMLSYHDPAFKIVPIDIPGSYSTTIDGERRFLPNRSGVQSAFAAYRRMK